MSSIYVSHQEVKAENLEEKNTGLKKSFLISAEA